MARDTQKLEAMVQNNLTLQGRHEKRLKAFWLLKSRPRILTVPALLAALVAHNDDTGKEHSHAEKLEIVRQQMQLRKQLDRIHKMGDMKLQNHGQVGVEDPLELCVADFKVILQHEATHGIPKPLPPSSPSQPNKTQVHFGNPAPSNHVGRTGRSSCSKARK
jgi:hypothetical protein